MDWGALLYEPIYGTLGVSADLLARDEVEAVAVTVIDKTSGAPVGDSIEIQTIRPAADVRASEILAAGLTPGALDGGTLTIATDDGPKAWLIDSHFPKPGPAGETGGEIRMILIDESAYV